MKINRAFPESHPADPTFWNKPESLNKKLATTTTSIIQKTKTLVLATIMLLPVACDSNNDLIAPCDLEGQTGGQIIKVTCAGTLINVIPSLPGGEFWVDHDTGSEYANTIRVANIPPSLRLEGEFLFFSAFELVEALSSDYDNAFCDLGVCPLSKRS